MRSNQKGFTLMELSIVLVIIGLLIGGVLIGQSMIQSAKINGLISDVAKYEAVISQFKDSYGYYPGDLPNATTRFGSCPTSSFYCDGDGDGALEDHNWAFHSLWWQLSKAGYIDGDYTVGRFNGGRGGSMPIGGTHTPNFGIERDAWGFMMAENPTEHFFRVGTNYFYHAFSTISSTNGAVKPATALAIDTKMDDGIRTSGEGVFVDTGADASGTDCYSGTTYSAGYSGGGYPCILYMPIELY